MRRGGSSLVSLLGSQSQGNLLLASQHFASSLWLLEANAGTPTDNSTTAPNGTTTGALYTPTSTTSAAIWRSGIRAPENEPLTLSIYVKDHGLKVFSLQLSDDAFNANARCDCNLSTGVATPQGGATGAMTSVGNGWYRCSVTYAAQPYASYTLYYFVTTDALNTANGTNAFELWGAQLNRGSSPTLYVPTRG